MTLYYLTPSARIDLLGIRDYIALDNPDAAERVMKSIKEKCHFLGAHPKLTAPQKRYLNLCKHKVGNYLIFYRAQKHGIEIIRVLHASRDIETLLSHPH